MSICVKRAYKKSIEIIHTFMRLNSFTGGESFGIIDTSNAITHIDKQQTTKVHIMTNETKSQLIERANELGVEMQFDRDWETI